MSETYFMSETCSICLDSNFVDSISHDKRKFVTKCNHLYHFDCIYRWAQQNNSCPTCRMGNLIDEFIIMNYDSFDNDYYDSDYYDNNEDTYQESDYNNDYNSDYNSILSSIRRVRLNLGNLINDQSIYYQNIDNQTNNNQENIDNQTIDNYLDNLTDLFINYYTPSSFVSNNNYSANLPSSINTTINDINQPEVINLRMNMTSSHSRSNHPLRYMNFR